MLSASECLRYQDEGYAIARGVFSPGELEEIRAACDELEATARDFAADAFVGVTFFAIHRKANPFARDIDRAEVVPGQLRRVTYPYAASPTLNAMRTHRRLLDCAASILGPDLVQIVTREPPQHQDVARPLRGDEGAASTMRAQRPGGPHATERLADHRAADAEGGRELRLGRQLLADRELAAFDALQQRIADLVRSALELNFRTARHMSDNLTYRRAAVKSPGHANNV